MFVVAIDTLTALQDLGENIVHPIDITVNRDVTDRFTRTVDSSFTAVIYKYKSNVQSLFLTPICSIVDQNSIELDLLLMLVTPNNNSVQGKCCRLQ